MSSGPSEPPPDLVLHRRALRRRSARLQAVPRAPLSRSVRLLGRCLPRRLGGGDRSGPRRQPPKRRRVDDGAPRTGTRRCASSISTVRASPRRCSSRTPLRRSTRPARSTSPGPRNRRGVRAALRRPARAQPLAGRLLQRSPQSVGRFRAGVPRRRRPGHRGGALGEGRGPARRAPPERPRPADGEPLLPGLRPAVGGVRRARAARPSTHELPDRIGARGRERRRARRHGGDAVLHRAGDRPHDPLRRLRTSSRARVRRDRDHQRGRDPVVPRQARRA